MCWHTPRIFISPAHGGLTACWNGRRCCGFLRRPREPSTTRRIGTDDRAQRAAGARMRLKDKVAIVIGADQSPGEGMGNGRATVLRFAQEGAKVLAVDSKF